MGSTKVGLRSLTELAFLWLSGSHRGSTALNDNDTTLFKPTSVQGFGVWH